MELNRDEILKWWELCANDITCRKCPYEKVGNCQGELMQATLDIFKELTEKYENLEMQFREIDHECDRLEIRNEELTEENERLKAICDMKECVIENSEAVIARTKADTVRKMQSEIEARCIKGGIYPAFVKSTIDQIAEEMIGEKND